MPPRKRKIVKKDESGDPELDSKPAKRPKVAAAKKSGPYKMPPPLPKGEILTDFLKKRWTLNGSIGKGGFGEIYSARPTVSGKDASEYVVKIEPHENGPLFTELSFYRRAAKAEMIDEWVEAHHLKYLSIPKYINSGVHDKEATKYRFMVMERYGDDLEKLFNLAGRVFNTKTVCYLGLRVLEGLEYLHTQHYAHADIKASNILTGYGAPNEHKVYLVDYGLAYRYLSDDKDHRGYSPNPKRAHDGTINYTSIDAHDGANPSRRGDLEILGYCLIEWAGGKLPWNDCLENKSKVATMKKRYKGNTGELLSACFTSGTDCTCLNGFMEYVYCLGYCDEPNYDLLKQLLTNTLKELGAKDDKSQLSWLKSSASTKKSSLAAGTKRKKILADAVCDDDHSEKVIDVEAISETVSPAKPKPKLKAKSVRKKATLSSKASPMKSKAPNNSPSPVKMRKKVTKRVKKKPTDTESCDGDATTCYPVVAYPPELGYVNGTSETQSVSSSIVGRKTRRKK